MNYIIIEDEPSSRLFLQEIMLRYHSDWKLLGVCSNVSEGIEAIRTFKPDLVLLDIEIGEGTAFDILNVVEDCSFKLIFITAYEHYALKAIKYAALDYILKPIDLEELKLALDKTKSEFENSNLRIKELKKNFNEDEIHKTLMLPTVKGYQLVQIKEIAYIEANGQYVFIHLLDKRKFLVSHSLGYYEELLKDGVFFRAHKSFIVNVTKVTRVITQNVLKIELVNNAQIDLAIRRKEAFLAVLKAKNKN